jgi:hypothetical protein
MFKKYVVFIHTVEKVAHVLYICHWSTHFIDHPNMLYLYVMEYCLIYGFMLI